MTLPSQTAVSTDPVRPIRRAGPGVVGLLMVFAALLLGVSPAQAATRSKANNNTVLSTGTSWAGGTGPAAGDTILWNNTVTSVTAASIGAGETVTGLTVTNPAVAFTISANGTNSLTIGTGGINMSAATQNFTIASVLLFSANQSWTVNTGRTLTVSGAMNGTAAGRTMTFNGAGNYNLSGGIGANVSNLTMSGTGNVTIAGTNAYTGTTNITTGMIIAASASALGTTGNGTNVSSGAALGLQGGVTIGAEPLNINGTGVGTTGALRNLSGTNTFGGAVTLGGDSMIYADAGTLTLSDAVNGDAANRTLTFDGAGNFSLSGGIGGNVGNLTMQGDGNLTISDTNAYTGFTNITTGMLIAASNSALGTTGNGTTVSSGAALGLQGGVSIGAETLTISGTGLTNTGALRNISGTNTFGGAITIGAATTEISADAGTMIMTGTITGNAAGRTILFDGAGNVTANGTISTNITTLTKNGAGLLTLNAANSYTGNTTINAGTAAAGDDDAFSTTTIVLNGGSLAASGGARTLTNSVTLTASSGISGSEALSLSGTVSQLGASSTLTITNTAATTISGGVVLAPNNQARTLTIDVNGASGGLLLSGTVQNGTGTGADALTKNGGGLLTLSGTNTYNGTTTINAGTLAAGSNSAVGTGGLTLNGGTLASSGGLHTLTNTVSLAGSSSIGGSEALSLSGTITQATAASSTLTVSNTAATTFSGGVVLAGNNQTRTLTFNVDAASGGLLLSGTVAAGTGTGADGLIKNGGGVLTLSGTNTYNGTTTINAGTLAAGSNSAVGTGGLTLNGGTLAADGAARTLTNAVSLAASSTLGGSEDLSLSGTFTQTGASSTLFVTNSAATTISGGLVLAPNNQARTLTVDVDAGSGGLTVSGTVQNGTGTGVDNLVKDGNGVLTLSANNSYNGTTTISGGTLSVAVLNAGGTNSGIGNSSAAAANLVLNGGSLQYTGGAVSINRSFTVSTAGGGLDASGSGNLTFSNTTAFTLGGTGDRVFTLSGNNTGNNTLASAINNPTTGATSLTKEGAGQWILTGASGNFTGTTTVNDGTLTLGAANILGAGPVTVNGGTLNLGTFSDTVGLVTLTSGNISSTTGVLTGTNYVVESGTISAILGGTGNLTKQTSGTVYLTANNTYSGNTTITGGILSVGILNNGGTNSGIGSSSAAATSLVLNGGTLQYTGGAASIDRTLTLGTAGGGLDASGSGNLTFSNTTALTINSTGARVFTLSGNNTGNNTLAAPLNNSTSGATSLVKDGDGTWIRTGGGNFTGGTTVSNGVLIAAHVNALGSGTTGVVVENGGTLGLQGGSTFTAGNLTLNGFGEGGVGALVNISGNNIWGGNISINASASISSGNTSGTQLELGSSFSQNLTLASGKDVTFTGGANTNTIVNTHIIGGGNVTVDTAGTVTYFSNGNTYTGATLIANGTLIVDTPNHSVPIGVGNATLGIQTSVEIGDGIGSANTSILQLGPNTLPNANEVMSNTTAVTINQDGRFWLNNQNQTIGALEMTAGNADSGPNGVLFLNGDVVINADATASVLSGVLALTGHNEPTPADRLFTVASGGNTTSQLTIDAIVQSGGLTKAGDGIMLLTGSGDNTYTGATEVDEGILRIAKNKALGAVAGNTTVADNAQLQLSNNITVTSELLNLNGTGIATDGALQNFQGDNTWTGIINLESNSTIESLAGTNLTHSGTMSSSASHSVVLEGAGNITQSGSIASSINNVTKNDGGTLTFSGSSANAFTGNFTINGGTVNLAKSDNTVAVSGTRLTVNSGGTLLSSANEQISNSTPMTLNGGSWFTQGNDEVLGTLTLTANSIIDLGTGSSIINFANSSGISWTGGAVLTLQDWSGVIAGGGTDQVYFGSTMGGLTGGPYGSGQIAQIKFLNPTNYAPGLYDAQILATGEVVPFLPVPEPSTYAAGAALVLLAGAWEYRRRQTRQSQSA